MPLDRLLPYLNEAEAADYCRLGRDNLHVRDATGRAEALFCHESDIHFTCPDKGLVDQLKAGWLAEGICDAFVHLGSDGRATCGGLG